ncbi:MAG: hypothetical protein GSR79_09305 [Desulfurococcales archaeon]|nr:hypothetical protein [Desulfurococcales archaeon]
MEIESFILQHPKVDDAAVIGVMDEKWGEAVKLIIKPKSGEAITKNEIIAFLEKRLPRYKLPKYISITDIIPRNPTGKILRRVLKEKCGNPRDDYCH